MPNPIATAVGLALAGFIAISTIAISRNAAQAGLNQVQVNTTQEILK